mgnify:CR=1 FL=1
MSHKTRKTEEKKLHRGPTFVGLSPKVEPSKKEREEKLRKKHKKKIDTSE